MTTPAHQFVDGVRFIWRAIKWRSLVLAAWIREYEQEERKKR